MNDSNHDPWTGSVQSLVLIYFFPSSPKVVMSVFCANAFTFSTSHLSKTVCDVETFPIINSRFEAAAPASLVYRRNETRRIFFLADWSLSLSLITTWNAIAFRDYFLTRFFFENKLGWQASKVVLGDQELLSPPITRNRMDSNPLKNLFSSSSFLISFRFPPVGVKFLSFYIFFSGFSLSHWFFSWLSCVCPRVWSHSVEEGGAGRAIAGRYIIWPRCPSLGDSTHRRVDDGAGAKKKIKRTRPTADCWEITKKIKVVRGHSKNSEQEKKKAAAASDRRLSRNETHRARTSRGKNK